MEKSKKKGKPEAKQQQQQKGSNGAFFDIAGIDAKVSHHPPIHEVDCPDPVGHSLLMSVSEVPSEACRAEDRDGVLLQLFSTKVWTLCPVSCQSILGRRRGSTDEPDQEVY